MAEWLYEEGIGENRAALLEDDEIVDARIELPEQLRAGTVADGRLTAILIPAHRGIVMLDDGSEALLEPLPPRLTEGQSVRIEIVREALPEPGRPKLPKCRVSNADVRDGPELYDRLVSSVAEVTKLSHFDFDLLEKAGWSALIDEASSGEIVFIGGSLRMSLTPAMTLFDVDGTLASPDLARCGAAAAGRAIRRFGIGGSIGIDLPTVASKGDRQAAAAALDAVLPQPFERTAVNGFGFLQVVRKRERPSLPELVQADPAGAAARLLIRRAERAQGSGERMIHAAPSVIGKIEQRPAWLETLERRIGAPVGLRPEPGLAIWAGHVQSRFV